MRNDDSVCPDSDFVDAKGMRCENDGMHLQTFPLTLYY